MVTGVPPFVGDNLKKLSECILLREPNYDHKCIQYDYALKDLLKRMLWSLRCCVMFRDKNPLTRISIKDIMNHEWVTMDGFYPINRSIASSFSFTRS